ncbi:MAG: hypothetical protein ACI4TX_00315, partial [Christensenellales bacterium]
MKFYSEILKWKDNGPSVVNSNGNELICYVHENVKDDYLHILFYPLNKNNQKQFENDFQCNHNRGLEDYSKFIFEHNGSVLYSGAIVFFGYTDNI